MGKDGNFSFFREKKKRKRLKFLEKNRNENTNNLIDRITSRIRRKKYIYDTRLYTATTQDYRLYLNGTIYFFHVF